ncbi:MAG: TIR domain-containing protein, partial [Gammaproteobacteria bacterium]
MARAVQENLDPDFETKIWDQDVFRLSQYPLESLLDQLLTSDFGVFVLAPDDVARMRGKNHLVARDNVIFELGLFAGRLGRNRTFVITPRGVPELHLPTDLLGLTAGDYDPDRVDKNLTAAMGAVCNKTRRLVSERGSGIPVRSGLLRAELFTDFTDDFGPPDSRCQGNHR